MHPALLAMCIHLLSEHINLDESIKDAIKSDGHLVPSKLLAKPNAATSPCTRWAAATVGTPASLTILRSWWWQQRWWQRWWQQR
jgi:hypothetical protein